MSNADVLIAHLGMSGSFAVLNAAENIAQNGAEAVKLYRPTSRLGAHDHAVFHFDDGARLIYNDPRRFGYMLLAAPQDMSAHPRLRDLGVEPLEPPLDPKILRAGLARTGRALKVALLDQKIIAGLGNIYVCEVLHLARLSPWARARDIDADACGALAHAIVKTLSAAIEAGGSSLRDFSSAEGRPGYFQHQFRVYDREGSPCPGKGPTGENCGGIIARTKQAGRPTFYCPTCQS